MTLTRRHLLAALSTASAYSQTTFDTAINNGRDSGMMSFNDSLHDLIKKDLITIDTAVEISDNPEELKMIVQGIRLSSGRGGLLK